MCDDFMIFVELMIGCVSLWLIVGLWSVLLCMFGIYEVMVVGEW